MLIIIHRLYITYHFKSKNQEAQSLDLFKHLQHKIINVPSLYPAKSSLSGTLPCKSSNGLNDLPCSSGQIELQVTMLETETAHNYVWLRDKVDTLQI